MRHRCRVRRVMRLPKSIAEAKSEGCMFGGQRRCLAERADRFNAQPTIETLGVEHMGTPDKEKVYF